MSSVRKYWVYWKNEFRQHFNWFLAWAVSLCLTVLLFVFLYPGKEEMKRYALFLQDPRIAAVMGINTSVPIEYSMWLTLSLQLYLIITLAYGLLSAPRYFLSPIEKNLDEITLTLPIKRETQFLLRILVSMAYTVMIAVFVYWPLFLPSQGEKLSSKTVVLFLIGTINATFMMFALGLFISMFLKNTGRGQQLGLLLLSFLYILQVLSRVNEDFEKISDYNPLTWFDISDVLLKIKLDEKSQLKILFVGVLFLVLSFFLYSKRDLAPESSISFKTEKTLPLFKALSAPIVMMRKIGTFISKIFQITGISKAKKQLEKNRVCSLFLKNPLVGWAHGIKRKLPFTAEFIFSESKLLTIMFWLLILFFPVQLMMYNEEAVKPLMEIGGTMQSFIKITLYLHVVKDPYLWYLATQAIGTTWIYMVPLVFVWVKKITDHDADLGTGEITGTLPTKPLTILYQRLLAVLLEMIELVLQMILWVFLSHLVIGKLEFFKWEVISLLLLIPFYFAVITGLTLLNLVFEQKGVLVSRLIIMASMFWYIFAAVRFEGYAWYKLGLLGIYDPVGIILEKTIVPKYSLVLEILFSALFLFLMKHFAKNIRFVKIE